MSLTLDIWTEMKAEAQKNGGALTPKQILPYWNRAMEKVHGAGKISGGEEVAEALKAEMKKGRRISL